MKTTCNCLMALLFIFLLMPTAVAQSDADSCKDILVNKVFNTLKVTNDTFFWMTYASMTDQELQKDESSKNSFSIGYAGITLGLSKEDASRLRSRFSQSIKEEVVYQNRSSLLLESGQENIVNAWRECMQNKGGGLSAYFAVVPGRKDLVDLHIVFDHAKGFDPPSLKIAKDVDIDASEFKVVSGADCLKKGYTFKPGDVCTPRLRTKTAWSSDVFNMSLTDGRNSKDLSFYLGPRAILGIETKPWPSATVRAVWAKDHRNQPVNQLSRYADEATGGRAWDLSNERPVEEGWFFVEGKRQLVRNDSKGSYLYSVQSDYIKSDATTSGVANTTYGDGNSCTYGYRVDPTATTLSIGIGLGAAGPGEHRCTVTYTATMARFVWDDRCDTCGGFQQAQRTSRRVR